MSAIASAPSAAPASGLDADAADMAELGLNQLRVGATLTVPIYDHRDVLLLAQGRQISERFLQRLLARRIKTVRIQRSAVEQLCAGLPQGFATSTLPDRDGHIADARNESSDLLDADAQAGRLFLPKQGEPFADQVARLGATKYDTGRFKQVTDNCLGAIGEVNSVYESLAGGEGLNLGALEEVAEQAMADFSADGDLFTCLGINPFSGAYPARHSLHTAMLALAIGTNLQLDRPTLKELVVGCLLHDAGMLGIDIDIFNHAAPIDSIRFLEVTKHPVRVFDMLLDLKTVSSRSAFIAYQVHERCDGSGYPRRREASQIHFLSKVAAVADVYVALVSPRPHRPALLPYKAVEKMLTDAGRGVYDKAAVRALLKTVSLFPVGSFVELSDGRQARVIRTGSDYLRPVIEVADAAHPHLAPEPLDLGVTAREELFIVRALPALDMPEPAEADTEHWE